MSVCYARAQCRLTLDGAWLVGKRVVMKKGKYAGKTAYVKERVNKKYRVEIKGVGMKLEFYPTSFAHINEADGQRM